MALGHLLALLALDEARRADRIAANRAPAPPLDEGLNPSRAEIRASAWSRWMGRRDDASPATEAPRQPAPRRAAHV
jgi:hypothetical protein